ncbi:M66 family metalloprotease, partial [Providencia huashanensis]|uniref:M66 family metalloprotease n=1 Tax=Providencia huashanensis TaxID=3037798 RepID=UPI002AFF575B
MWLFHRLPTNHDVVCHFRIRQQNYAWLLGMWGEMMELMINTIDIGMLTPPRNEFDFQNNHELNRQYGQTVPAATLIVTRFDPVYLTQVVTPRGELFIDKATGEGGGHDGNMRHEIAKDLIS